MGIELAEMVRRFDNGSIRLPLMQRDYVWKPKKVVRLLDSLYRGWPIGSFYVWHTTDDRPTRARAGAVSARRLDGFYGFLLDGQQRLTSLSLALQSEAAASDPSLRGFFDIENEVFVLGQTNKTVRQRVERGDPLLVPLSDVVSLDSEGELDALRAIDKVIEALGEQDKLGRGATKGPEYRRRLARLSSMLRREALCEEFNDDHEEHAFELFSRLNKGGTSLSSGDVEAARLASAATQHIVGPMREFVATKAMKAMGINFVFLLRVVVTIHRSNCSFAKLPRNWADDPKEIQTAWKETESALRATVEFVNTEMGWTSRRWLPSTMALIPVAYLLAKTGATGLKPGTKAAAAVRSYLLATGLRSVFRGSTETTVNSYVNAVRDARGDLDRRALALWQRVPKNRLYPIKAEDVRMATAQYSPLMQVYLSYLFRNDAASWMSGRTIRDLVREPLDGDPLAVHHIFPKKFMADRDFPVDQLNTAANYAILAQSDNAQLSALDPLDAFRALRPAQRSHAEVQLFFSASDNYLRREAYEEYMAHRSKAMAAALNSFVGLGRKAAE
jgi:hypothetical protein